MKSTMRFPTSHDEPCTLSPSPPNGGTKRDFAVFASKIYLLSSSLYENVRRKVVATSFFI